MSQLSPLLAAPEAPRCQLHVKKEALVSEAYLRELNYTGGGNSHLQLVFTQKALMQSLPHLL